jgi:RHS repeat-associated protein
MPPSALGGVAVAPTVTIPKGGGAVRGIGEKFSTNPATGTATLSIPLPTSPGRSGFTPALALRYDSGAGHGVFGLGWDLGLPSISRKTDKGVPTYDGHDVFILSGAEDLVPVRPGGSPEVPPRTLGGHRFSVLPYRPRVEGLYARIERWTREDGDVHWRSISRDNVTTVYGRDPNSRIADPADPRRIFTWLVCASQDDKGNAAEYEYLEENSDHVDEAAAHERHRDDRSRSANRYLKFVRYGNRHSHLTRSQLPVDTWMFELVFDYGEHDEKNPSPRDKGTRVCRRDPFSSYRAGFEVRTYRLCQRILMFHHFPGTPNIGADCLVTSMALRYRGDPPSGSGPGLGEPTGAVLESVRMTGHRRGSSAPVSRALPPLELEYTTAALSAAVQTLDATSLESLPEGVDEHGYRFVDLDGESISGVLTEQAGGWYYKPGLGAGRFGAAQALQSMPSDSLSVGGTQLVDLAGDGRLDLVRFTGSVAGFYERDEGGWTAHRPFVSLPQIDWDDPDLRLVDLNGDGHADVLVTEDDAVIWYPSLGEEGFGSAHRLPTAHEDGGDPRPMFTDGTGSVFAADVSGDGLADLVRARNGEICYWPNLGHGRFGAEVVMDDAPLFDHPDRFDPRRLRPTDVDGTGPIDLIYLGGERVDVYLNRMGNGWAPKQSLAAFPPVDDVAAVTVADLFGRGTPCLVWSSALPGDSGRQVRYVDLMGAKPHLLTRVRNNLGGETVVGYSTSTASYLADKAAGTPWATRLPFPVHVVEKVETYDHISRTRFVSRYRHHHGRFDGVEREFCGFALVEQEDTEQLAALVRSDTLPIGGNADAASHVPPVLTRTWFHTGAHLDGRQISTYMAPGYYPPADHVIPEPLAWRLSDSVLDGVTTLDGEGEAWRALKGQPLRQEVYALDGTPAEPHPYSVVEHSYTVRQLQSALSGGHGVFAVEPRETVTATCERTPEDARVAHELILDADPYGNVTHSVAVAYRRAVVDDKLPERTRTVQATTLVTETRTAVTTLVDRRVDDRPGAGPADRDAYRVPVPYDVTTRQVIGPGIDEALPRLARADLVRLLRTPGAATAAGLGFRLVARQRIRFASDENPHTPLPFGTLGRLGLVHESYTLALPDALVDQVYGTRVGGTALRTAGYVAADGGWWAPSGTVRYTPHTVNARAAVLDQARIHFFLPRRFVDPFAAAAGATYWTSVEYDANDLLPVETVDALGNTVTAGERNAADARVRLRLDYRVLTPTLVTDPNRNRVAVVHDALGRVAATAVMGKPEDDTGDRVDPDVVDPDDAALAAFQADPHAQAAALLGAATTRTVYDNDAYLRTRGQAAPQPVSLATLARETHVNPPLAAGTGASPIQVSFSYADGLGREIQKKLPAEPATVPPGAPPAPPRWVASGWVVLNNKGKPVRQYEPFFTPRHAFDFAVTVGISPVLCYDPLGRAVATLHPNHTYDKVVLGAWEQTTWDVNDTVAVADPTKDGDVGALFAALPPAELSPTWYQRRIGGGLGQEAQAAATRTLPHGGTPARTVLDPLGRPVLTLAWNRTPADGADPGHDGWHRTYSVLDVAGHQSAVLDCPDEAAGPVAAVRDRLVARYTSDLAGRRLLDESMEAGHRRTLHDIAGQPLTVWQPLALPDPLHPAGEQRIDTVPDRLRRPQDTILTRGGREWVVERRTYGEAAPDAAIRNLRTQVWELRDEAGLTRRRYDVKGNLVEASRSFARAYRDALHWGGPVPLETETWTGQSLYDALNRPTLQRHPDTTVIFYAYEAGGRLTEVMADLPGLPLGTAFVRSIRYDPHGRRTAIDYGNGVRTSYEYEKDTFRLARILTLRGKAFPQDDPTPPDTRRGVQDLRYTYDPVGNITNIVDAAQPRVFNLNTLVDASTDYLYDALYRLVAAGGREHLGLKADGALRSPSATSWNDAPRVNPADRNALGRYTERYTYDTAGNMTLLRHRGSAPTSPGWRRGFAYHAPSQLPQPRADLFSNRLTSSRTGTSSPPNTAEVYAYDTHGNMTALPPLQSIAWDFRDQLAVTSRQTSNTAVPETTYSVYDSTSGRSRKITDSHSANPTKKAERLYIGGFELYREFDGHETVTLSRTTVHMDVEEQRVAIIETRTDGSNNLPLVRYQFTNNLGSVVGELDGFGEPVSYEEYYPYGCTALLVTRAGVPPKRYRHTAKERDEGAGLNYHGARHYAPWLARWLSADPMRVHGGLNAYEYCLGRPTLLVDNTGQFPLLLALLVIPLLFVKHDEPGGSDWRPVAAALPATAPLAAFSYGVESGEAFAIAHTANRELERVSSKGNQGLASEGQLHSLATLRDEALGTGGLALFAGTLTSALAPRSVLASRATVPLTEQPLAGTGPTPRTASTAIQSATSALSSVPGITSPPKRPYSPPQLKSYAPSLVNGQPGVQVGETTFYGPYYRAGDLDPILESRKLGGRGQKQSGGGYSPIPAAQAYSAAKAAGASPPLLKFYTLTPPTSGGPQPAWSLNRNPNTYQLEPKPGISAGMIAGDDAAFVDIYLPHILPQGIK